VGCEDDSGGGSDDVGVFVMFTTLVGPTQPITLVVEALAVEHFNACGPVRGVTPAKPGFGIYTVGGVTPGKLVTFCSAVGADLGLIVRLVGEWERGAIEGVAKEGGGAMEVEGGRAAIAEEDELGVVRVDEAGGSEGCACG
jgi:hypothetical protein